MKRTNPGTSEARKDASPSEHPQRKCAMQGAVTREAQKRPHKWRNDRAAARSLREPPLESLAVRQRAKAIRELHGLPLR